MNSLLAAKVLLTVLICGALVAGFGLATVGNERHQRIARRAAAVIGIAAFIAAMFFLWATP